MGNQIVGSSPPERISRSGGLLVLKENYGRINQATEPRIARSRSKRRPTQGLAGAGEVGRRQEARRLVWRGGEQSGRDHEKD